MAALTVQTISKSGVTITPVSATALGDTIADDGKQRTFLEVINGGESSIDVTISKHATSVHAPGLGAVAVSDIVVAVGAGVTKLIGPFPDAYRGANGVIAVGYSAVTSVTVAAIGLPRAD